MDKTKVKINNLLILLLLIYSLFAFTTIKQFASPTIDGIKTNNLIIIVPIIVIIKFLFIKKRAINIKLVLYLLIVFLYFIIRSFFIIVRKLFIL